MGDDNEPTQEDMIEEAGERAQDAAETEAEHAQSTAEDRAAAAQRAADEVETVDYAKAAGKGAGKNPDVPEGGTLHEEQIDEGKAPIAPGPEQDVDPDDAERAKQNRGR